MSFIDKSGEPRSDQDIKDAIRQVELEIIKFRCAPELLVFLPTIREGLKELLVRREQKC